MTRIAYVTAVTLSLAVAACGTGSTEPSTGLIGRVIRGPITPVCPTDIPCAGPFAARFIVRLDGRVITGFDSDSLGRFQIALEPGVYEIHASYDAPVKDPANQSETVRVLDSGLTLVELHFDTGIR